MASVQYLFSYTNDLKIEIDEKKIIFDCLWKFRNLCACIIQRQWRGYACRKNYLKIRWAIITIQSYYRGWVVRKNRKMYLLQHQADMDLLRRNKAAVIIQAAWRGYLVRKYMRMHGGTPADRVRRLRAMNAAANEMRDFLKQQYAENAKTLKDCEEMIVKKKILYYLFKWHHLIRTRKIKGIFSCHCSQKLSFIEELMKVFPFKKYMDKLHECYRTGVKNDPPAYFFESEQLRKIEDALRGLNRDHELRPETAPEVTSKRFDFNVRIEHEAVTGIDAGEPWNKRIENLPRSENKQLNITEKRFDTDCLHLDLNERTIPYYIDYFENHKCRIHHPPLYEI